MLAHSKIEVKTVGFSRSVRRGNLNLSLLLSEKGTVSSVVKWGTMRKALPPRDSTVSYVPDPQNIKVLVLPSSSQLHLLLMLSKRLMTEQFGLKRAWLSSENVESDEVWFFEVTGHKHKL